VRVHLPHFINENWKPYLCNVNSKPASILVDVGIRTTVPDPARQWLLWAWVYFKQPRADGLSSSEEFATLCAIEDKLTPLVEERCRALAVGRITTDGRREFYYYGPNVDGFEKAVRESLSSFDGYDFAQGNQYDPQWNQYLTVLFPSDEDMQRISNREVTDLMERQGDQPEVPREILHWCYFAKKDNRAEFSAVVMSLGYTVNSESENPASENPYGVCFGKIQEATAKSIDEAVIELHRTSKRFNGEYDGWEAQVMSDEGAEKPDPKRLIN